MPSGGRASARQRRATRIGDLSARCTVEVFGVVQRAETRRDPSLCLEVALVDGTGTLALWFFGRDHIPGIAPGTAMAVEGTALGDDGHFVVYNPRYEIRDIAPQIKAAWLGTRSDCRA